MTRPTQSAFKMLALLFACTVAAAVHAAEAEPLRWKFTPGMVNRYRIDQSTVSVMDLGAGKVESRFKQTIDWNWRVEKVDAEGTATLTQTIERVQIEVAVPGGQSASFDSKSDKPAEGFAAMLAPLVEAMTAGSFTATMTNRGEVKELVVSEAVLTALANSPGAAALGELATAEGFKKAVGRASFVVPEKLEPGTEWTVTTEVKNPSFGVQKVDTTYKYLGAKEVDGQVIDQFKPTVNIRFEGDTPTPIEVTGQESEGEVLFNRTAGRLEKSAVKTGSDIKFTVAGREIVQKTDATIDMEWLKPDAEKK